jgi:hypothetical protein
MLIPQEISLLVSSDPGQGAINIGVGGSSFEIQLDDAIKVPKDAVNVTVTVEESTVWWTVPNVITGQDDTFYVFGDDNQAVPVPQLFVVVIPQGLYDLPAMNNALLSGLEALGARTVDAGLNPLPLVTLAEDTATNKVVLRLNYTNAYVDFVPAGTPRDLLGFDALQYGPNAGAPLNILAPNVAALNTVNYFLIASDLVQRGLRFNNQYNQVVTQVLIDVSPGSQIVSTPFNPAKIDATELAGAKRSNLRFRLTDERLNPVNTNGEFFTARIVIKYLMPFVIQKAF